MSGVRACDTHGYFEGESCPVCGDGGTAVLDSDRRRRLSKFVSGALRHFPEDAGLTLDDAGWTPLADLVTAVERQYDWADHEALIAVIATDPKGRFERDERDGHGDKRDGHGGQDDRDSQQVVRVAYGHSVDVALEPTDAPVPDTLYHGTARDSVAAIRAEGLKPMSRQQVHLSGTVAAAREVGRRHTADPVVFEVDAAGMAADGHRVTKRGESVYTTDAVPPAYLTVRAE